MSDSETKGGKFSLWLREKTKEIPLLDDRSGQAIFGWPAEIAGYIQTHFIDTGRSINVSKWDTFERDHGLSEKVYCHVDGIRDDFVPQDEVEVIEANHKLATRGGAVHWTEEVESQGERLFQMETRVNPSVLVIKFPPYEVSERHGKTEEMILTHLDSAKTSFRNQIQTELDRVIPLLDRAQASNALSSFIDQTRVINTVDKVINYCFGKNTSKVRELMEKDENTRQYLRGIFQLFVNGPDNCRRWIDAGAKSNPQEFFSYFAKDSIVKAMPIAPERFEVEKESLQNAATIKKGNAYEVAKDVMSRRRKYNIFAGGGSQVFDVGIPDELLQSGAIRFDDGNREIIVDLRRVGFSKAVYAADIAAKLIEQLKGASGIDLSLSPKGLEFYQGADLSQYKESQPLAGCLVQAEEDYGIALRFDQNRLPARAKKEFEDALSSGDVRYTLISKTGVGKTSWIWGIVNEMAERNYSNSPMHGEVVALKLRPPNDAEIKDSKLAAEILVAAVNEAVALAKELKGKGRDAVLAVIFDDLQEWFPDGKIPEEAIAPLKAAYNTLNSLGADAARENQEGYRQVICWASERRLHGLGAALEDAQHRTKELEIRYTAEDLRSSVSAYVGKKVVNDYKLRINDAVNRDKRFQGAASYKEIDRREVLLTTYSKALAKALEKTIKESNALREFYKRADDLASYMGAEAIGVFANDIIAFSKINKSLDAIALGREAELSEANTVIIARHVENRVVPDLVRRLKAKVASDKNRYDDAGTQTESAVFQVPAPKMAETRDDLTARITSRLQVESKELASARAEVERLARQERARHELSEDLGIYSPNELLFLGNPGGMLRYLINEGELNGLEVALTSSDSFAETLQNFGDVDRYKDTLIRVIFSEDVLQENLNQAESYLDSIVLALRDSSGWATNEGARIKGAKSIAINLRLIRRFVNAESLAKKYERLTTDYRTIQELASTSQES